MKRHPTGRSAQLSKLAIRILLAVWYKLVMLFA